MRVDARGEFHRRTEALVLRHVLGRDPVRALHPLCAVLGTREPRPARAAVGVPVVFACDLCLVRHEVVVEHVRRAEIETARVGEDVETLPVRVAPALDPTHRRKVAVQLTPEVEAVEEVRQVVHTLLRADLHVHRGARLQLREVVLHELRDERRGCRHARERAVGEPLDGLANLREERPRLRLRAVAVGVEEQVERDAGVGEPPEVLQLALHGINWRDARCPSHGLTARRHCTESEVHVIQRVLARHKRVDPCGVSLISNRELHV